MRTRLSTAAASILLAAVFANPASAQDAEPIVLDATIVTASRLPIDLEKTPGSTTVVSREEIDALAPASTSELLGLLPGTFVTGGGGSGSPGYVHTRGADPNFTAVYIDGVRVNDPTDNRGGAFDFNSLDPSEIEKIEIVRGPLSSVHGSSALAGAIVITTRSTEEQLPWANAEGGSDGFLRLSAGSSQHGANWSRQARVSSRSEGEVVPGNDFESRSVNFSLDDRSNDLSFRYNRSERRSFPDASGGPSYAVYRDTESEESDLLQLDLASRRQVGASGSLALRLSGFQKDSERESPGIAPSPAAPFGIPASESDGRYRRGEVELSYGVASESDEVLIGTALSSELGDTEGIFVDGLGPGVDLPTDFRLHRRVGSFFAEGLRHHRHFTLQMSVRMDRPEDEDSEWSPRVGLRHRMARGGGSLKANWGESFKLASLYALGDPLVGDPSLENEESRGWDVAWIQPLFARRVEFEFGYFDGRYTNLIDIDFSDPAAPRMVNRDQVDIRGVELALRARAFRRLRLSGQLSQSRSEIRGSGEALQDRPEWTGSLTGQWRWAEGHSVGLELRYVGAVESFSYASGAVELDDYVRLDVNARYSLGPRWSALFALDNVLDENYEEAVGFPSAGLRPRVGISYR